MVQTRQTAAGIEPQDGAVFGTPKRPDPKVQLAQCFERLTNEDGVTLPYTDKESPSKRRKSPGHDAVKHINFLFWQDPDALARVLGDFSLQSPTLYNNDAKLNNLLETLTVAVQSTKRQGGTPRSERRWMSLDTLLQSNAKQLPRSGSARPLASSSQHATWVTGPPNDPTTKPAIRSPTNTSQRIGTPSSSNWPPPSLQSTPLMNQDDIPAPPSPTLSVKHAPKAPKLPLDDVAKYPYLPPPSPVFVKPALPEKAAQGKTTANTSFTSTNADSPYNRSANTSFATTANNTSFWSEVPQGSQEMPLSQATSIASLDGANDDLDIDCTQETYYGSSLPYDEPALHYQTSSMNNKSTQTDYGYDSSAMKEVMRSEPKTRRDSRFQEATEKSDAGSSSTDSTVQPIKPPASVGGQEMESPAESTPSKAGPAKESPTKASPLKDSPSKESPLKESLSNGNKTGLPLEHFRVKMIPSQGLAANHLYSEAMLNLPWDLQFECARVLQACDGLSADELESQLRPRTFERLHQIAAERRTLPFRPSTRSDYEDCSLHIRFQFTESKSKHGPLFVPRLLPPQKDPLNSFQHKFGHDRFLSVEVDPLYKKPPSCTGLNSEQMVHVRERFLEMLAMPQKFLGRKWLQFHAQQKKANKKSTIADNTETGRMQYIFFALSSDDTSLKTLGLRDVVGWAISFTHNMDTSWCKLYSRLDLRVSRTQFVISLNPEDIELVEDRYATNDPPDVRFNDPQYADQFAANERYKPDTVMDDGCSVAHPWLFRQIEKHYECKQAISVAQFRLAGAKGLISRKRISYGYDYDPDERPTGPLICINKSQLKLNPGRMLSDKDYSTLQIVGISQPFQPALVYMDFLPILIDRGVPPQAIEDLALKSAKVKTDEYLQCLREPPTLRSWINRQNAAEESRRRDVDIDTLAGVPKARLERAILMLESGFDAMKFAALRDDIQNATRAVFDRDKKFFRLGLEHTAYIKGIADPTGTLEPGQIYFASSNSFNDPITNMATPYLQGDVLVARNPAERASDMQKVTAVRRAELTHLYDVVVFSTKGPRPLADKLAGGDYDGDTFWVCWEPTLVRPFKNAPAPQQLPDPATFGIEKDTRKLSEIMTDPEDEDQVREFVQMGTRNRFTTPDLLGIVTTTLARLTAHEGLQTVRGHQTRDLKDHIMDCDKNGLYFGFEAWKEFKKARNLSDLPIPAYFQYARPTESEVIYEPKNPDNILDRIVFDVFHQEFEAALARGNVLMGAAEYFDPQLAIMYDMFYEEAKTDPLFDTELKALRMKLSELHDLWNQYMGRYRDLKDKGQENQFDWDNAVELCKTRYQDIQPSNLEHPVVREWIRRSTCKMTIWDELKASAMAKLWHTKKLWINIVTAEICQLKAEAKQGHRVLTKEAYMWLGVRKSKKKVEVLVEEEEADLGGEGDEEEGDDGEEEFFLAPEDFEDDEVKLGAEL